MAYSIEQKEPSGGSYGTLLKALRANKEPRQSRKKRRLNDSDRNDAPVKVSVVPDAVAPDDIRVDHRESLERDGPEEDAAQPAHGEPDDEKQLLEDPFQQHYMSWNDTDITRLAAQESSEKQNSTTAIIDDIIKKTWAPVKPDTNAPSAVRKVQDLHLKSRLLERGKSLFQSLSLLEKDFTGSVCSYHDVIAAYRTVKNVEALRDVSVLHSLNHVFKTRDRILKNNAKLSQSNDDEAVEARDQGFARPKVLVVAPTKQSCVRFVESIVKFSEPDQQENKSRFQDQFSRQDGDEWLEKPDDFQELFGGNHEEDFRIGLKFTRKTIKFFSGFYNSDIIIASPLGLMRTITNGSKEEDGKSQDSDFLSSIEVAIMDHATALQMQNWQHVEFVFSHLNLLPKESHGCDFSRVRHWYLDGHAKHLRQTIILSSYLTPEISSLASEHLHNITGRVKYVPSYKGAILDIPTLLPTPIHQTFIRFSSTTALTEPDTRFKHFISTLISPLLKESPSNLRGILIFAPSYIDFIRLRNHFSTTLSSTAISFTSISEYTPVKEVNRARSHFVTGRHNILLYSERAHHHFRYRLRGVRRVVFYGIPENPVFWTEIVGFLGLDTEAMENDSTKGKGLVRALFSKWDALKLERVVGTERVAKMFSEKGGDTFDFV